MVDPCEVCVEAVFVDFIASLLAYISENALTVEILRLVYANLAHLTLDDHNLDRAVYDVLLRDVNIHEGSIVFLIVEENVANYRLEVVKTRYLLTDVGSEFRL